MATYFVPYTGKRPTPVMVNGHKFILLSKEKEILEEGLPSVGADRVKAFRVGESEQDEEQFLADIAYKHESGIAILPPDIKATEFLRSLEAQLPWLH